MLLIFLFLIIAGGAGVLGRVLDVSAWMVVPLALAAIAIWFLATPGVRRCPVVLVVRR